VAEADRDVELVQGAVVQLVALPLAEGGRPATKVHHHVHDRPARTAHQLGLAVADREVDPPHHAVARAGVVVLHEGVVHAELGEGALVVGLREEAALVPVHLRLEQERSV